MKKILFIGLIIMSVACIHQTTHKGSTFLEHHSFSEVWDASIKAVYDIAFTVDSLDRDAGFIGAQSGQHVGQDLPPRLSIMISDMGGKIFVDCRVLHRKEFIDIFGHGKRTIRKFMTALNTNLNVYAKDRI